MLRWLKKPENILGATAIALFTLAILIHFVLLATNKYRPDDLDSSEADNTNITEVWPD